MEKLIRKKRKTLIEALPNMQPSGGKPSHQVGGNAMIDEQLKLGLPGRGADAVHRNQFRHGPWRRPQIGTTMELDGQETLFRVRTAGDRPGDHGYRGDVLGAR